MNESNQNLWDLHFTGSPICITTNGTIKKDGSIVMGRGCAAEAKKFYRFIPRYLGNHVRTHGNTPTIILQPQEGHGPIISFPVKHNWYEAADPALIQASATALVALATSQAYPHVYLPRPGCGNGRLSWADVAPLLAPILDHRFTVCSLSPKSGLA